RVRQLMGWREERGLVGWLAQDAVIGRRRVGDVRLVQPRHVTREAVIVPLGAATAALRAGMLVLVAVQAPGAVEGEALGLRYGLVRIVAGGAAKSALAGLETLALKHLLDVANRLVIVSQFVGHQVDGPEVLKRKPGAEVEESAS